MADQPLTPSTYMKLARPTVILHSRCTMTSQDHHPLGIYLRILKPVLGAPLWTPVWWAWKCLFKTKLQCTVNIGNEQKLHPGVAEGYQLVAVAALATGVSLMPATEAAHFAWRAFAGYRAWEILVYALKWFFVDPEVLHSYRRSVLAFLFNIAELSAAFTVLGFCLTAGHARRWSETFLNVGRVLKLEIPESIGTPYATLFAIEAWVLVVFVLACAIGGISRKTEEQSPG